MSVTAWPAMAVFAVAYVFIATEKIHRVAIVAVLMRMPYLYLRYFVLG